MGIAFIAAVLGATALIMVLTRHAGTYATVTSGPTHPASPLDEAERILARRYAQAEITAEEYSRMLAILRR